MLPRGISPACRALFLVLPVACVTSIGKFMTDPKFDLIVELYHPRIAMSLSMVFVEFKAHEHFTVIIRH